jgi:hypothetical protein
MFCFFFNDKNVRLFKFLVFKKKVELEEQVQELKKNLKDVQNYVDSLKEKNKTEKKERAK